MGLWMDSFNKKNDKRRAEHAKKNPCKATMGRVFPPDLTLAGFARIGTFLSALWTGSLEQHISACLSESEGAMLTLSSLSALAACC